MTTYIFENEEVVLTGRLATKTLRNNKQSTLVEIKPKDNNAGDWLKWVNPEKLLKVVQHAPEDVSKILDKIVDK